MYGGGAIGLMGAVANACLSEGGKVTGIMPSFLIDREIGHHGLTQLIVTNDMDERKNLMMSKSDVIVLLPGGFGSLEEFFIAITKSQLGQHKKPVVILNIDGYYDPLLEMYERVIACGFGPKEDNSFIVLATSAQEIFEKLPSFHYVLGKKFIG